eukprot:CAMPEP_0183357288 /NCGR_PEP_ID=MMETSP0164_2-20130417/45772_1 /TAXON_ID=221442 /ORGANISM="Coccolithus pelagicus ssp braarudi, Strain PLY182g" /LENGTH=260 /DNA_ID=CAMNT_0025530873 /DNA_START=69 /DNA_END=851 /DNA_ORIENTATION=+
MAQGDQKILEGKALYDALYRFGYGGLQTMLHARPLIDFIRTNTSQEVHSVLDVGCSVGHAVRALWRLGFAASGVDVSSVATEEAEKKAKAIPAVNRKCVGTCFQPAPVQRLPFEDRSFDAIMSSDVLEHISDADVPAAIHELTRVSRLYLVLKIANRIETVKMNRTIAPVRGGSDLTPLLGPKETFGDKIRAQSGGANDLPETLHLAVHHSPRVWIRQFTQHGFDLVHTISVPDWACCAFVLKRGMHRRRPPGEASQLER